MTQRRRRMGLVHAVAWATCLAMPLPGQAQEGKLRQPASPPTATVLNPVPKDLKVKPPAGEPPACAPGEPSPSTPPASWTMIAAGSTAALVNAQVLDTQTARPPAVSIAGEVDLGDDATLGTATRLDPAPSSGATAARAANRPKRRSRSVEGRVPAAACGLSRGCRPRSARSTAPWVVPPHAPARSAARCCC